MGIITKTLIRVLPPKYSNLLIEYKIQKEAKAWHKSQLILQKEWKKNKNFIPPPHIAKQEIIKKYARQNNVSIFVETGTYMAYMIDAMKNEFKELYSIELSKTLYERASNKYKNIPHIHFIHGDSAVEIDGILKKLEQPCLFWLDGHYSGGVTAKADVETPIIAELRAIFKHPIKKHIILIDDARLFNGTNDYPTLDFLHAFIKEQFPIFQLKQEQDIIIICQAE